MKSMLSVTPPTKFGQLANFSNDSASRCQCDSGLYLIACTLSVVVILQSGPESNSGNVRSSRQRPAVKASIHDEACESQVTQDERSRWSGVKHLNGSSGNPAASVRSLLQGFILKRRTLDESTTAGYRPPACRKHRRTSRCNHIGP